MENIDHEAIINKVEKATGLRKTDLGENSL